jgi:hypothetical protein
MKKLVRELNIETFQKNLIKANYLQILSYTFIAIDLFSSTSMEILKLVFDNEKLSQPFQIFLFASKVN